MGVLFHTDQGSQFTSSDFRKETDRPNMIQSFSAKGHPYDNAIMKCFFNYLKERGIKPKQLSIPGTTTAIPA